MLNYCFSTKNNSGLGNIKKINQPSTNIFYNMLVILSILTTKNLQS